MISNILEYLRLKSIFKWLIQDFTVNCTWLMVIDTEKNETETKLSIIFLLILNI